MSRLLRKQRTSLIPGKFTYITENRDNQQWAIQKKHATFGHVTQNKDKENNTTLEECEDTKGR
jgi:hypothetical protein